MQEISPSQTPPPNPDDKQNKPSTLSRRKFLQSIVIGAVGTALAANRPVEHAKGQDTPPATNIVPAEEHINETLEQFLNKMQGEIEEALRVLSPNKSHRVFFLKGEIKFFAEINPENDQAIRSVTQYLLDALKFYNDYCKKYNLEDSRPVQDRLPILLTIGVGDDTNPSTGYYDDGRIYEVTLLLGVDKNLYYPGAMANEVVGILADTTNEKTGQAFDPFMRRIYPDIFSTIFNAEIDRAIGAGEIGNYSEEVKAWSKSDLSGAIAYHRNNGYTGIRAQPRNPQALQHLWGAFVIATCFPQSAMFYEFGFYGIKALAINELLKLYNYDVEAANKALFRIFSEAYDPALDYRSDSEYQRYKAKLSELGIGLPLGMPDEDKVYSLMFPNEWIKYGDGEGLSAYEDYLNVPLISARGDPNSVAILRKETLKSSDLIIFLEGQAEITGGEVYNLVLPITYGGSWGQSLLTMIEDDAGYVIQIPAEFTIDQENDFYFLLPMFHNAKMSLWGGSITTSQKTYNGQYIQNSARFTNEDGSRPVGPGWGDGQAFAVTHEVLVTKADQSQQGLREVDNDLTQKLFSLSTQPRMKLDKKARPTQPMHRAQRLPISYDASQNPEEHKKMLDELEPTTQA